MSHTIKSVATRVGTSGVLVLLTLFVALSQPVRTSPSPVMFPSAAAPAVADAAPQAGATSITFTMLATCGSNTPDVDVIIGGTVVGTLNSGNDCTCEASLKSFTTSDPAALALLGDGCSNVTVGATARTGAYISWIRADINRSGSVQGVCLMDTYGGSCTEPNLCNAGYSNYGNPTTFTATAAAPDADGDGQSNCSDPDSDNDGLLNAADNCPLVANVTQDDTDGNGLGDACDPFDRDNDGVWNINDNCSDIPNPAQADADTDGIGDACEVGLVAVPWLGSEVLPHQVTPGGTIVLQAVATGPTGEPIALASASWNPGDGSGVVAVPHADSLVIEKTHTYAGVVGQPFTATVTATDTDGNVYTDTFNVVIAANNRETRVNMAIDKGLWNLHKEMNRTTSDGQPSAFWTQNQTTYNMTATANAVQAFAINNHRESGDPSRDPYVRNVARGMRYILSEQHGMLRRLDVPTQNGNNPDDNGNGYGLWIDAGGHASYLGGSFIDAIVASGTPNRTADVGQATYVRGRRYIDIVQDMLDGYSWGMADDRGGWYYSYQDVSGSNDTSASHWWAIGVLAAEVWGLDAPEWVKDIQRTVGIPLMQNATTGAFGYTNSQSPLWDDATNVTSAGMIMMNADDMASSHARFQAASNYINTRYASSTGNFYTMFQLTKAMRTALDGNGDTAPIELLNGTTDWYAGYADFLVANQNGAGAFTQTTGTAPINEDMATAWAIIILSPSLFELPPTAACSASPSTLGTNGGLVQFSAAASSHPDPDATIVSYAWNFGDGATATGVTTSHTYGHPPSFPTTYEAQVTVTDSNGLSTSSTCAVTIVDTNVPPNPVTGGPYDVCIGSPVILNGSASADEDGTITSYAWSWGAVINFTTPNATSATVDATAAFTALGPGVHNVGLQVTDNDGASGSAFTTVRIRAANDATCNQPPAAVNDTASTFSGTPVSINVVANDTDTDNDPLTVTGTSNGPANGTVTNNGGGTVTYTPNLGFAGTDTFTYAISDGKGGTASATVTVTVTKRSATVTAGSGTKVFGTADPVLTPSSTGFLAGDNIVVTQTARDAGENVGTYATHAEATGATLANYDVTVINGTLEITISSATATATGGTFTYDGQPHGGTCSVAPVTGTEVLTGTISYSPGSGEPVTAGSYTVTCDFAGTSNYAATSGTATITINKATATVTAGSDTKVYGTADPVLTPSSTGFLAGDNIVVTQTARDAGENVGTYATHATATGAALTNYDVTTTDGTLVITPAAAVVVATGGTFTYNGQPQGGACSVAPATGGDVLTGTISYSPAAEPVTVGSYTVTCDFAGTNNYSATNGTATIVINPAVATVTAGSGTKVFGAADPVLTPSSTGFLAADNIVVSQTARDAGENVGTYATHATATGAALGNYAVTVIDGTLDITIATVVATATGGTFTYDGQPHGGACTVGPVADLTGTISYSSGAEPVAAGSYTVTCDFAGTSNYAATSDTATITINAAPLSVTANSYTRSYLAADPVFGGVLTGVIAGDGITATYSSTGAGSQVPGVYPTVPALVDPNSKVGNYAVSSTNGTLTITNTAPVCVAATATPASIWPPNHQWVPITINGITDVDGGPLTISIVSIFQDEPTNTNGDGNTSIDGKGVGTSTAWVRAERMGKSWKSGQSGKSAKSGKSGSKNSDKSDKGGGNGRVYHITFTATDSLGMTCTGTVLVGVPHDQSGPAAVDDGALYDSTVPTANPKSDKSTKSGKSSKSNDKSSKSGDKSDKQSSKSSNKPGSPADKKAPVAPKAVAPKGKK